MKTTRTALITDHLKLPRYSMADFWVCCPFHIDEFKPDDRTAEIRSWRQVGMVWGRLEGLSQQKSARLFYRDHATCLNAEKVVLDTLIDVRMGCKHVKHVIEQLTTHCHGYARKQDEMCLNELVSLIQLENTLAGK